VNAIVNATHFCIALGKFDGVERLNIYCAVMKKKFLKKVKLFVYSSMKV